MARWSLITSGVLGNVQSINAHSIVKAVIGGNLVDQIQTFSTDVIGQSSISGVQIGGDCYGDITCAGSIHSILVTGDLGSTAVWSNVSVATHIYTLKAANIYADIVASTSGTFVSNIETTKTTSPKGTFVGSLVAADLNADTSAPQRFHILGDLDADITIASGIKDKNTTDPEFQVDGKFKAGRTIRLNGYDATGTVIKFTDPLGLEGQVIINGDDNHPASPLWRGAIQVDGVTLSPKNEYTQTGLGGGAIGFAPFHLYDEDCVPANNLTTPNSILQTKFTPTSGITPTPIKVRFYGPVAANPSVPETVRVIHNVGGVEFNVTHRCDISVSGRTITIAGKANTFFVPTDDSSFVSYYSVQNFTEGSDSSPISDNVSGNPDVPAFEYKFELGSDCDANGILDSVTNSCGRNGGCDTDINSDGFVNGDDFDLFVILFAAGSFLADFDGSGFVNGDDYDMYVEYFAQGC